MERSRWVAFVAIIINIFASLYLYSEMPQQMAVHWNAAGAANGFMDKNIALFLLPAISVIMYLLLMLLPFIDPLKKNIRPFHDSYELLVLSLVIFLSYLHGLSLMANLGLEFNMVAALIPAFASLFFIVGRMLAVAKRNWSIGIRTPWTLSSDKVWDRTHSLGSKMYQASALLSLGGLLLQDEAIFFLIVPVLASSLFLVVYSFMEYKKLESG